MNELRKIRRARTSVGGISHARSGGTVSKRAEAIAKATEIENIAAAAVNVNR